MSACQVSDVGGGSGSEFAMTRLRQSIKQSRIISQLNALTKHSAGVKSLSYLSLNLILFGVDIDANNNSGKSHCF